MPECREEYERRYPLANGRIVTVIVRDTVVVEDPYLNLARAKALSVRTGEAYDADRTTPAIKDHLIKTNVSI
jgi:hypothetical protein